MEAIDRNIRGLYVLAAEEEWSQFRARSLEQVCKMLGAEAAAWLTQADDRPDGGELTQQPSSLGISAGQLQALSIPGKQTLALDGGALRGYKRGVAVRYAHHDSRLVSRIVLWFKHEPELAAPDMRRLLAHTAEAGALAL